MILDLFKPYLSWPRSYMTLLFQRRITQKNFKFNKSKNFSIPGAVSWESALLKVFLNSIILF
jgi:hypothetical protein